MEINELRSQVDRILEMGNAVDDFLVSDEFTSVDSGAVDPEVIYIH